MKPSLPKAGRPGFRNLVGSRIQQRRKDYGWSQRQFCTILKDHGLTVSRSGLAKIEAGNRYVLDYELVALAAALELQVQELIPRPLPPEFGILTG